MHRLFYDKIVCNRGYMLCENNFIRISVVLYFDKKEKKIITGRRKNGKYFKGDDSDYRL